MHFFAYLRLLVLPGETHFAKRAWDTDKDTRQRFLVVKVEGCRLALSPDQ